MILGIGHEASTGKDTFTMFLNDYIQTKRIKGLKIAREGFADRLYDVCHMLYGWAGFKTRQHYVLNYKDKDIELPALGKKPWMILEDVAKNITDHDSFAFINPVVKRRDLHLLIVPDVRRPVEFEELEKHGAHLIRVAKTGYTSPRRLCQELLPYKDRWHTTFYNDGTLQEFQEFVIKFADEHVIPVMMKYAHGELKL